MLDTLKTIVIATWNGFFENRLTSMAAAIAFYALFSVGPILLVAITIADPILGHMAAEEAIMSGLSEALGVENLDVRELLLRVAWVESHRGSCRV